MRAGGQHQPGHSAVAVGLPTWPGATLDDALARILTEVDTARAAGHAPVVVGHSAAATLAWMTADRRPAEVSSVVLVGGFPVAEGRRFGPDHAAHRDGVLSGAPELAPFPGWDIVDGADRIDMEPDARQAFASCQADLPLSLLASPVHYTDERRFEVPVCVVCPEFSPTQALSWIEDGAVPELEAAENLTLTDIETGHWPMFTAPRALARALSDAAMGALL